MSAETATSTRSLGDRLLAPVVGLCAAGPVIASTVRAVHDGWLPAGDQAIIATRAYDVLTARTPLVGQHSDAGTLTHHAVYSLGPMLFWLLALPARLTSPAGLTLTIGIVNTAAIIGAVVLARRRGGLAPTFITGIAVVLMSRSLAPEVLHDVWNPSAGLFPFTLLMFLAWSLACGEYRLLPVTVLVASFVAQCQLAFLGPSLGALGVGLIGLIVSLRAHAPGPEATAPGRPRGLWRWMLATPLVAIVCWTAPAIDQIEGSPGNLTAVVRTATANHSTLGARVGWRAMALAVGVRPWWLRNPASPWERKNEVRVSPGAVTTGSALIALGALLALAAAGLLRRRVELWAGALIALALWIGLGAVAAATPTTRLLSATLGYTMWLGSPVGMFVWLLLAWAAVRALAAKVPRRALAPGLASAAAVGAVVLAAVAVAAGERPDEHLREYRPLGTVFASLDRAIPAGRSVRLIGALGNATFRLKMAARFALVRRGIRPLSPGTDARLGGWYELDHHRYDCTVYVEDGGSRPDRRAVPIASVEYSGGYPVSVWVSPDGCARQRALGLTPIQASATTWVSYPTLLAQVRSGPLIRAIINPARRDVEIKFRDLSEWHAFYPAAGQPYLQRALTARHIRTLFVPRHPAKARSPATVHHRLRYIAAGVIGALALLAAGVVLRARRLRRRRDGDGGPPEPDR
jgi:hypothetical protein